MKTTIVHHDVREVTSCEIWYTAYTVIKFSLAAPFAFVGQDVNSDARDAPEDDPSGTAHPYHLHYIFSERCVYAPHSPTVRLYSLEFDLSIFAIYKKK